LKNKISEISQELLKDEANIKWKNVEIMGMKSQIEKRNIIIDDCHKQLVERDKKLAKRIVVGKRFLVGETHNLGSYYINNGKAQGSF
jgi:hypothetical protein